MKAMQGSLSRMSGVMAVFLVAAALQGAGATESRGLLEGVVYEDLNRNLKQDEGERGRPGVAVSNGKEVVRTDDRGRYRLPCHGEMVVFVTKPPGYQVPFDSRGLARFYYNHEPVGSPGDIAEYRGVDPTGDLPPTVDFPLFKAEEETHFKVVVLGDTQVRSHTEVGYLRDAIVSELRNSGAAFGISMGDNVYDVLSLYDRYLAVMGQAGLPFYYVPGNHDRNLDGPDDEHLFDTYKRIFGPTYYSFEYGKVHFVVLASVRRDGQDYTGGLGQRQLEWLENDLALVPADRLVVLTTHIPPVSWNRRAEQKHMLADRDRLYDLVKGRKALVLAGHIHTLERFLPGEEEEGWRGAIPFPLTIVGAACGSWWSGPKDERGIPLSYQRDGTPKGYLVFEFDGNRYRERYKVAGRHREDQMRISLLSRRILVGLEEGLQDLPPGVITAAELKGTTVVANIFSGSRDSRVECRVDRFEAVRMERNKDVPDPFGLRLTAALDDSYWPKSSTHIWTAPLPQDLQPGVHSISVHTTDIYGQQHTGSMLFEVW